MPFYVASSIPGGSSITKNIELSSFITTGISSSVASILMTNV
jgi:hypothetical protein